LNSDALENLEKKFEQYLRSVGMKRTRQKSTILRVFLRLTKPVSAMELLYPVKQEDIGCSFGTVCQTLKALVACGMATEIASAGRATRYTQRLTTEECSHSHLVCKDCGKMVEVHEESTEQPT
jgi:Fur family ferric uptake transcriptional regulator